MEEVVTPIEKMFDLIKTVKTATFKELEINLALSANEVEKIAKILEEAGLISINYPLFGDPKVFLKEKAVDKLHDKTKNAKIVKKEIIRRTARMKKSVKTLAKHISLLEQIASKIELTDALFLQLDDLSSKIKTKKPKFNQSLNELNVALNDAKTSLAKFEVEGKIINGAIKTLSSDVVELDKKIKLLSKKVK